MKLAASLLGDKNLSYRARPVGPRLQVPRQYPQPSLYTKRFDMRHRLTVYPSSSTVTTDDLPVEA